MEGLPGGNTGGTRVGRGGINERGKDEYFICKLMLMVGLWRALLDMTYIFSINK